jgi:putative chitinase
MSYFNALNSDQLRNIGLIVEAMEQGGITNNYAQAGILAVISKETNFSSSWLEERSYRGTSASQIRNIFGSRVSHLSDSQIDQLKQDDVAFFNTVYGGRYGNAQNEGYKYRGRGFNQITFKGNYALVSDYSGIDLVSHPEKLKDPKIASRASVAYFNDAFKNKWTSAHAQHYNAKNINDFKSLDDAVLAMYHANAGLGKPMYTAGQIESTGGLKKAVARVLGFHNLILSMIPKKKTIVIVLSLVLLAGLITGAILIFRNLAKKKK